MEEAEDEEDGVLVAETALADPAGGWELGVDGIGETPLDTNALVNIAGSCCTAAGGDLEVGCDAAEEPVEGCAADGNEDEEEGIDPDEISG